MKKKLVILILVILIFVFVSTVLAQEGDDPSMAPLGPPKEDFDVVARGDGFFVGPKGQTEIKNFSGQVLQFDAKRLEEFLMLASDDQEWPCPVWIAADSRFNDFLTAAIPKSSYYLVSAASQDAMLTGLLAACWVNINDVEIWEAIAWASNQMEDKEGLLIWFVQP
jgi:hypothetical protein